MTRIVNHNQHPDIDLLDGTFYAGDPHAGWTWMRQNAPAYYDEKNNVWALAGYDEVLAAAKDSATFSNASGIRPHSANPVDSMIDKDDPEHKARRMLVNRGFTPRRVRDKEDSIRQMCNEIVDKVIDQGQCDFVWDIAAWLPLLLIGDMLGFEREMAPELLEWSDDMLRGLTTNPSPEQLEKTMMAGIGFREYQLSVIADRKSKPLQEDLVSILVHGDIAGEPLDEEALVMESLLILIGGDEPPRHVISGGMLALLENPDQRAKLMSGEVPLEVGIEEMLRWVTPIKNMNRTATRDIEIGGATIAEGGQILLMYPSANRDEKYFDDPFAFDVERDNKHHIAFGFGTHFCLGSALARLELLVMFETLFERMPNIELAPNAELPIRPANFVVGLEGMPVVF